MPKLLVVATPIGNLSDASERVKQAFAEADLVAAEDTRVTMKLLDHFGIKKPLVSCHRHNEESRAPEIIARMLEEDLTVALCSDAGTPAVSDPGNRLVEAAWEAGVPVLPVFISVKNNKYALLRKIKIIFGTPIKYSELGFINGGSDEYKVATDLIFSSVLKLGGYDKLPKPENEENAD